MNKFLNWLVGIVPLRHKITVRIFQIRYLRAKRVSRALLLPHFLMEV